MTNREHDGNATVTLPKRFLAGAALAFAAAATPLLLFVSTTNGLYLKNAEDFGRDVYVLRQFWVAAAWALAIGLVLNLLTRYLRFRPLALPFWAYMLLGPFFLIYAFLHVHFREIMDTPAVLGGFLSAYVLSAIVLTCKGNVAVAQKVFARVFIFFVIVESITVVARRDVAPPSNVQENEILSERNRERHPNIYHILFDMFQTEMFEYARTPKLEEELAGLTYYPSNVGTYPNTAMAVPSVFQGDFRAPDTSGDQYHSEAFNSPKSLLHWLVKAGYETHAFMPGYAPSQTLLQHTIGAQQGYIAAETSRASNIRTFRSLWAFAYLPNAVAVKCADSDDLDALKRGTSVLPPSSIVRSYNALQQWIRQEADMSDHNRYTFMHLMMPHHPYVIAEDGSLPMLGENGAISTSVEEQVLGTTRLMVGLIEKLKELGRFEDSLIVIHADHGGGYYREPETGELKSAQRGGEIDQVKARSRSLLLIKLPGQKADQPLRVSFAETSLIDIAPTILRAAGVHFERKYPGIPLMGPGSVPPNRERQFHMFRPEPTADPFYRTYVTIPWIIRNGEYTKGSDMERRAAASP
ncbi:MAG TPA: sulfatase-like hydrolase/transferase [Candidatus Hydrogenedentes bacterium]|nr:sulfatase-like hydrolase/transferase [Candidatus Hydrogenedentota bacterium]